MKVVNPFRENLTHFYKKLPWLALFASFVAHILMMPMKFNIKTVLDLEEREAPKVLRIKLKTSPMSSEKSRQIVNTEQSGKKIKPLDSKYLGKTDQTFDRQTVAKSNGSFKVAGMGIRKGLETKKPVMMDGAAQAKAKKVAEKEKKRKTVTVKRAKINFEDLAAAQTKTMKEMLKSGRRMASKGLKNGVRGQTGLAKNNDFIEELPLGDMTNLNTIEYKYYGFYHRIRQKLEQHWGRNLKEKARAIYTSGRRIPASENRVTSLRIILDDMGNVVDVLVKSTSGVKELDDAAIESFNQAGPFPNPPKGMMKNGRAMIEWGFVVKG